MATGGEPRRGVRKVELVTLTQLGAFVLVARLGSVRAAADVLGVSEPAVSKAHRVAAVPSRRSADHPGRQRHDADRGWQPAARDRLADGEPRRRGRSRGTSRPRRAGPAPAAGQPAPSPSSSRRRSPRRSRGAAPARWRRPPAWPPPRRCGRCCRPAGRRRARSGRSPARRPQRWSASRSCATGSSLAAAPQKRFTGPPRRGRGWSAPSGTDPASDIGRLLRAFRVPESAHPACSPTRPRPGRRPPTATVSRRRSRRWSHRNVRRGELHVVRDRVHARSGASGTSRRCAPTADHDVARRSAQLPVHTGRHAADVLAGRRRAAVAVPPAGLRDDLELTTAAGADLGRSTGASVRGRIERRCPVWHNLRRCRRRR